MHDGAVHVQRDHLVHLRAARAARPDEVALSLRGLPTLTKTLTQQHKPYDEP